tara:strand:- start:19439 stop:20209 length:771 start_codon:yes stop_codon:yes gene_type:complete
VSVQLIDSHCHIDFPAFDPDRAAIMAACQQLGINRIVVPGVSADRFAEQLAVVQQFQGLSPAFGLHPCFLTKQLIPDLDCVRQYCIENDACAVGEIGLDFYSGRDNQALQMELFEAQLQLASELSLPVILHCRKAHNEILHALKKLNFSQRGVIHAFNANHQIAKRYVDFGFVLGIGGLVARSNTHKLRQSIRTVGLAHLVLETDAPDMTPPGLSRRNTPENIPVIAEHLANVLKLDFYTIANTTAENTEAVFSLT